MHNHFLASLRNDLPLRADTSRSISAHQESRLNMTTVSVTALASYLKEFENREQKLTD
jgi:hypothetical protein